MTLPFEPQYKDNRRIITCKEKGKEYIGRNPSRLDVACYRPELDSQSQGKACDYLLVVGSEKVILVELKGADLASAYSQILESCKRYREYLKTHSIRVRVINRNTPRTIPSSRLKLDQFLKNWGRQDGVPAGERVLVRSNKYEEDL